MSRIDPRPRRSDTVFQKNGRATRVALSADAGQICGGGCRVSRLQGLGPPNGSYWTGDLVIGPPSISLSETGRP